MLWISAYVSEGRGVHLANRTTYTTNCWVEVICLFCAKLHFDFNSFFSVRYNSISTLYMMLTQSKMQVLQGCRATFTVVDPGRGMLFGLHNITNKKRLLFALGLWFSITQKNRQANHDGDRWLIEFAYWRENEWVIVVRSGLFYAAVMIDLWPNGSRLECRSNIRATITHHTLTHDKRDSIPFDIDFGTCQPSAVLHINFVIFNIRTMGAISFLCVFFFAAHCRKAYKVDANFL